MPVYQGPALRAPLGLAGSSAKLREDPRVAQGTTTDHHAGTSCFGNHAAGSSCVDHVTVSDHREIAALDHAGNHAPVGAASVGLGFGTAVNADGGTLLENPVSNVESIQADIERREAAGDIGVDAILMMPDDISQSTAGWSLINKFASRHRLPVSGAGAAMTDPGVVFRYGPDIPGVGRQAAPLADKILQGAPAGTIPVVSAESNLRVNYKLAKALELTLPESWLGMASEINR